MIVEDERGIEYEIEKDNHYAKVISCYNEFKNVFIPRFIKHDS